MNILYLHGLLSKPNSPKITYMISKGHSVYNPLLDYKNQGNSLFENLCTSIKTNKINAIIGSSMGGYLAYHLGNKFGIPTLLFNPSLEPKSVFSPKIVKETSKSNTQHTVILGLNDEIVNPLSTITYLSDHKVKHQLTKFGYGHRTPLSYFKQETALFIKQL